MRSWKAMGRFARWCQMIRMHPKTSEWRHWDNWPSTSTAFPPHEPWAAHRALPQKRTVDRATVQTNKHWSSDWVGLLESPRKRLQSPRITELIKSLTRISLSVREHSFQPGTLCFLTTLNLIVIHIHGYICFDWWRVGQWREYERSDGWILVRTLSQKEMDDGKVDHDDAEMLSRQIPPWS